MKPLIQLKDLEKTYHTEAGEFTALKKINLSIGQGEFVGVIGKSGSGKSTLVNMITGIDRPTRGEVHVAGTPIHTLNENEMAKWRGKHLGIVFQFFQLLPNLTVIDNVLLPMDFARFLTPRERVKRAKMLLDTVDLAGQYDKLPAQLSGGQQQRVAIARALSNDPPILFADEPTGNLDSKTSEKIFSLFEQLVAQGKTILMVTHDEDQAKRVNRAIIIADGEIIEEYLSQTFPALSEKDLLWMSRKLIEKKYKSEETIIKKGEKVEHFYIVNKGTVEIVIHTPDHPELVVAEFGKGEFFGEIELLRGGSSVATARAKLGSDVELLMLPDSDFMDLLGKSHETHEQINKLAHQRLTENLSKHKKNGKRKTS